MAPELSCCLHTSLDSPEHARIAEQLGYRRAWFYDSSALCADVWTQLCRAADRTDRIALGPGVLVPALRHPMTTASAIATLVAAAGPERVMIGVGSGFTGRLSLGQRPIRWVQVAEYIRVVKALLRGEQATWEGAVIQMLHFPGFLPPRPIEVPFVVAAQGPKGIAVAKELADGVLSAFQPTPGFDWSVMLQVGTVLEDGEDPGSERVLAAAGHGAAVMLHFAVEFDQLDLLPNGKEWAAVYQQIPAEVRHLALHEGHLCGLNERDRPFVTGELLAAFGLALTPDAWREKLTALAESGVTEIAYQPAGPDIPRELEAFAEMMRG
ncbi:MAG: LLM class flavin-dependent oxidoreductase [Actinomycetota bacterium]|jgi:5,10-methylenetetrahydromethanopterin reductase